MTSQAFHRTVRVYSDGSKVFNGVLPEHLKEHVEYNTTFRFGCALFVDGKCVHRGYLTKATCQELEELFALAPPAIDITQAPYR